ncbi:MAG: carboxypeptidase-like regulatory domain-containing protein [Acidobacteriota bacterium]
MSMRMRVRALLASLFLLSAAGLASAQVSTGTVSGTVKDAQGGVVPGATATLISESRGTRSTPVTTNATGDFVFVNIAPDTYALEVTMPSFKTLKRPGVTVSAQSRSALGAVTLEIGGASETVNVTSEAPQIQATTGERSFTVATESVANLPIASRSFAALVDLTPGVTGGNRVGDSSSTGGGSNNYMMDGVSTVEPGSNRLMVAVNVESIAEVKVLTSSYQAEYGRSSGLQVTAITKSGSNRFHGSLYDVERNSDWNANSRTNKLNGDPKSTTRERDWGYSIGGPVGRPGGHNKLFFFYAQEFQPRTTGNNVVRFRVPTALERLGDFSQTLDNNQNAFPYIRDSRLSGTCSSSNQAACFKDGGVLGRIPASRLYQTGLNILNLYPLPNVTGQAYNYELTRPEQSLSAWQPVIRVDYQPMSSLRGTFKFTEWGQPKRLILGSLPGFNDTQMNHPVVPLLAASINYTINSTTFFEATVGHTGHSQAGCALNGAGVNFCTAGFSMNPSANVLNSGLGDLPFLYPDALVVPSGSYQEKALKEVAPPIYDGTRILLPPPFSWGNRIANAPPNNTYPGFVDRDSINDFSMSLTRVMGPHTVKAGFYDQHSAKQQNRGNPFGALNFGNDTNNPIDSGFGFANAALGVFSSYSQASRFLEGNYVYNNAEFYVQDNWKLGPRLTLDYGVRFVHQQPQYDTLLQASNFLPERYDVGTAPILYVAGCANGVYPCSGTNRQAKNPLTGQFLGPNSTLAIGAVVPGTGDQTDGIRQSGNGIAKTTYTWPGLVVAPRFGMAYDVMGSQKLVVRGGGGLFYDRPSGNSIFDQITNPPIVQSVTVRYAQLQSLGSGGLTTSTPPTLTTFEYDSNIPSSAQWNAGVQMALPWSSALDISYVGQHGYNILQGQNLNAVDLGAAFLPQNQDPSLAASATPGASAVTSDQMRAIRGFSSINQTASWLNRTYHSVQISLQRRFSHGLSFGFNDTMGLYDHQNTTPRFEHGADGSFRLRADQATADKMLGDNNPVAHLMKANFVWDLPDLKSDRPALRAVGLVINDWQLSGIWTGSTGSAYSVGFSYQNGGSNVNLTGSPDFGARINIVGDPGAGCSGDPYRQFNTSAFQGPSVGSVGLESGNNYVKGCSSSALDLSIARNIRLGGGRAVQLRVDLFNAPDQAGITGRNASISLANPNDPITAQNLPFDASGNLIDSRSRPRGAGFGVANGYQSPRSVQAQVRFQF